MRNKIVFIIPVLVIAGAFLFFFFSGERVMAPSVETGSNIIASETENGIIKAELQPDDTPKIETQSNMIVIETEKGIIKAELRLDDAPKTVRNFTELVARKFYDGLTFHRVEPGFVIQGGDPKGDGTGGSGMSIPLEIKCQDGSLHEGETVSCSVALSHMDGALAMARAQDPDSASSQFYITIGEQPFLDGNYAVFGYVTEGFEVVRAIERGDVIQRIFIE